jgi:hypothetical protein
MQAAMAEVALEEVPAGGLPDLLARDKLLRQDMSVYPSFLFALSGCLVVLPACLAVHRCLCLCLSL